MRTNPRTKNPLVGGQGNSPKGYPRVYTKGKDKRLTAQKTKKRLTFTFPFVHHQSHDWKVEHWALGLSSHRDWWVHPWRRFQWNNISSTINRVNENSSFTFGVEFSRLIVEEVVPEGISILGVPPGPLFLLFCWSTTMKVNERKRFRAPTIEKEREEAQGIERLFVQKITSPKL